jgi:hypothetical protein
VPPPALEISGVAGELDAAALGRRRVALRVTAGVLRLSEAGLALLLPPALPLKLERIADGRVLLRGRVRVPVIGDVDALAEIRPRLAGGRIRLEVVAVRAGMLPVPPSAIGFLLRGRLPDKPGLSLGEGDTLEIDLAAVLAPLGIELPVPSALGVTGGMIELNFAPA